MDVWSLGMVILEQYLGRTVWAHLRDDLHALFRKTLSLIPDRDLVRKRASETPLDDAAAADQIGGTGDAPAYARILHEHHEDPMAVPPELRDFLADCLCADIQRRPSPRQLLLHPFFASIHAESRHQMLAPLGCPTASAHGLPLWVFAGGPGGPSASASVGCGGAASIPGMQPGRMQWASWQTYPVVQSLSLYVRQNGVEPGDADAGADHGETDATAVPRTERIVRMLQRLPLTHVYHIWTLAGGDVEAELRRRGRISTEPPIFHLPVAVRAFGHVVGARRDVSVLYDDTVTVLPLDKLVSRLADVDETAILGHVFGRLNDAGTDIASDTANALLDWSGGASASATNPAPGSTTSCASTVAPTDAAPRAGGPDATTMSLLPPTLPTTTTMAFYQQQQLSLTVRERDVEYQFRRLVLFQHLLACYPWMQAHIVAEARIDIPPAVRGAVWAAVLGIRGDYAMRYESVDRDAETPTDRQLEVDIPRCHQYHPLLLSPQGHEKLFRVLKSWLLLNPHLVYWQGLDSLCAPFLVLHFNDEAMALACLDAFIQRFLNGVFASDNAAVMQEQLLLFAHLLAFHDPLLAVHFEQLNFVPELYAIPWLLTFYTRAYAALAERALRGRRWARAGRLIDLRARAAADVFPLDKIFHLWDALLLGSPSLPLCIGIGILEQFREQLLVASFNDCITLFSDMPDVSIERVLKTAYLVDAEAPPSITQRAAVRPTTGAPAATPEAPRWWELPPPIEELKLHRAASIALSDLMRWRERAVIVDVRSEEECVAHCRAARGAPDGPCDAQISPRTLAGRLACGAEAAATGAGIAGCVSRSRLLGPRGRPQWPAGAPDRRSAGAATLCARLRATWRYGRGARRGRTVLHLWRQPGGHRRCADCRRRRPLERQRCRPRRRCCGAAAALRAVSVAGGAMRRTGRGGGRVVRCTGVLYGKQAARRRPSELLKDLLSLLRRLVLQHLQHVEAHRLAQRPALANHDRIARLNILEGRRNVRANVAVSLLEPVVLLNVVQIVTSHHQRALHPVLRHRAGQDASADAHVAGERALFVNVRALDRLPVSRATIRPRHMRPCSRRRAYLVRRLEAQADVTPVAWNLCPRRVLEQDALLIQEDGRLLLECALRLLRQRQRTI